MDRQYERTMEPKNVEVRIRAKSWFHPAELETPTSPGCESSVELTDFEISPMGREKWSAIDDDFFTEDEMDIMIVEALEQELEGNEVDYS